MVLNIKRLSELELLRRYYQIIDELKTRKVVRTYNNPVADYAEWLVAKKLNLKLSISSHKGYDAIGKSGKRYQIKARRLRPLKPSRQMGVIRNLKNKEFDILIGILFNEKLDVEFAYAIPIKIILKFAQWSKHQNGYILQLRGSILTAKSVKNITPRFR